MLFLLHHFSCTKVAIKLTWVLDQRLATLIGVESHTLVRRLPCHPLGHREQFAQSLYAYITFSYLRGVLVRLQWTSWCLVFDVITQSWAASSLCLDALSECLVNLGCKCAKCILLGTSKDAVVAIVGIVGCRPLIELLSPNKGSFPLDPSFGLASRLICDCCLHICLTLVARLFDK